MKIVIWTARVLVGVAFFMAGLGKLTQPYEALLVNMPWVENFTPSLVKIIALLETLGAIGIFLPLWLKKMPILSAYAALGLAATMAGAIITHLARTEFYMLPVNLVLGGLAAFVAWHTFKEQSPQ